MRMAGRKVDMAGLQSKTQAGEREVTPYKVPDMNKPPSAGFFNQTKVYFKERWAKHLSLFSQYYGSEELVFKKLHEEMTKYCFNTESNNITHFYYKYREHTCEAEKELSSKVCPKVQQTQANVDQSAENATQTKEAQE